MIYALLAAVMFAVVDLAWRQVLLGVSIWQALVWRSLSSTLLLLLVACWFEDWVGLGTIFGAKHAAVLAWPTLSGVVGLVLFTWALQMAPAALVVPIVNLTGLGVWFWDWGLFGQTENPGWLVWLSVALAAHGVLWWVLPVWQGRNASRTDAWAALLSVMAVVIWSRGYVEYPEALEVVPPLSLAAAVELLMLLLGLVFAMKPGGRMQGEQRKGALLVGVAVAGGVACTTLAYASIPASEVALLSMLTPVLVVLAARLGWNMKFRRRDVVAIGSLLLANLLHWWSFMS